MGNIIYNTTIIFLYTILVMCCASTNSLEPVNDHSFPDMHEETYSQSGDINIGAISITLEDSTSLAEKCSGIIQGLSETLESTEAIAYAVDVVNRSPDLLPNVTLGFTVRGICPSSPSVALASSLSFLPRSKRSLCNESSLYSNQGVATKDSEWLSHDVIGLVSPGYDSLTSMISSLYSVARLPIIGATEVSDQLSNKDNHPYFFRIVPPNKYMVEAMLQFMSFHRWSYISIVYQEGSYGRINFETMQDMSGRYDICIATSHMLTYSTDYDKVVFDLLLYSRARVVVLFVVGAEFRKVLRGVNNNNATGHFVFVAGDAIIDYAGFDYVGYEEDEGIGTFVFDLFFKYNIGFYDYLRKQRVYTTENPWFKASYEYIIQCSFDKKKCNPDKDIFSFFRYRSSKTPNLRIDAALAIAHAAHNLLSERCPDARGIEARACVTGDLLREYLKNVTFRGTSYKINFNENQENGARYSIGQFVYDRYYYPFAGVIKHKHMTTREFAMFSAIGGFGLKETISWSHLKPVVPFVPRTENSLPIEIPESVCSRPCVNGEYKIEKELPCCWECQRCRNNERLINGNTSCEACPQFTWPDPTSDFTTCKDIQPTFPAFGETIPVVLVSLASFCIIVNVLIFICYVIYRNERVIKASSRELSFIQLIAIFVGYTTIILFQTAPTDAMCVAVFFLFCMSFALLYCPLLIKTVRIVRIFKSGAKNERPSFISPRSQITFSISLITVQVLLCAATYLFFMPRARHTQLIWSEKNVELSCDLTLPGLGSCLCFNIVLVALCSVFGFMVRNLPDNFNESKFISMCVSTTLLIWLAFTPTYFTADKEYIKAFLLAMALLLNHSVALVLLFFPKMYAVIYLSSGDDGKFSNQRS